MPAYVSHTIMARDVYNRINNKNVDLDYMITFSLGGDLCKYSKCRYASHHIKEEEFLYNMCNYIKDHYLMEDKECMGVLYGHICHLVMDREVHPLIRKVDSLCEKRKNNHALIELYYDNYLTKQKYDLPLNKYDNKELFKGQMNKKICNMIDEVYKQTYDCDKVSKKYKFNLSLYKKIRFIYNLTTFNFLKRVSGIKSFLKHNKDIDILNNNHKIIYIGEDKKESNDNLDTLYERSVYKAVQKIQEYNNYLGV